MKRTRRTTDREPFGNAADATTQLSSAPTNVRVPSIYNGQLYVSSSSPFNGVNQVGTGLPTTSDQTTTLLPGLPNGNPFAFVLLDRDADVPGVDTLYIADQTKGLLKYTFADGMIWATRGNIPGILTGLTGTLNGASVTLYATLRTAAGNALVTFTDTAAFDADISPGPFTILVNAAANTVFRGVAFAPDSNQ